MKSTVSEDNLSRQRESRGAFSITTLLISGVILFFLTFQAIATFRVLCPPEKVRSLSSLRIACSPALWPFLDYTMYWVPHYQGEQIPQLKVVGTLGDGTKVEIRPEDLNLRFWYYQEFLRALDQENHEAIHRYAVLYEEIHGVRLASISLENDPVVITNEGIKPGTAGVIREVVLKW